MNLNHLKQDVINEINNGIDEHGDSNFQVIYDYVYDQLAIDQGAEFISNFIDLIDETFEAWVEMYTAHARMMEKN